AQGPVSTPVDETLPPVVVRLVDATGDTAVVTGIPVTLALGSGPPATLSGATTRATENGLATFDDLSINTVGSGYTLVASSPDLTGATSAPFEIVPLAADRLVFLTQPTDTAPSATLPPILVQIQDATGTPLPARTDPVTLTTAGGPESLAGTTARNAVGGVATFDDLSVDVAGEGYTLQASAPGLVSDTSLPFDVVAPGEPLVLAVTSTADAGPGTLRQALLDANANTGHRDTIVFDVPAPYTIAPATALPVVTDPVVIDGTTQPGYTGVPIVQIDGSGSLGAHGLSIIAGSSIVRGLAIHGFDLAGISLSGGGGSTIQGNYLGTNPAGAGGIGNTSGLETQDSSGNLVSANVLSGNAADGLLMTGGRGNRIESNLIGVHPAGTTALANGNDGISTWPSSVGPVAIADTSIRGNVISGNGRYGIMVQAVSGPSGYVSAEDTEILGNTIGLDVDGNALGNAWSGIGSQFASGLVIGRPSEGNVISGNIALGISIAGEGSVPAIVQANRIGTDPTGMLSRGYGGGGISIVNSPGNRIGGSAPGEENVISNLDEFGIQIQNAIGNIIEGNLIGTNADGDTPVGPQLAGIWLTMASSDTVIRGNVISGHAESGVWVQSNTGVPIARTLVQDNRIGTDPAGAVAVPNALDGVRLMGGFTTDSTIRDNVVSGNLRYGVLVLESTRTDILANRIGTNAAGTAALGNGWSGIEAHDADQTTIGRPGEGNVISANGRTGISIISSVGPNLVQANKIGTDVTGTVVIPNTEDGVRLSATGGDTIGGPNAGEGNIISGNGGDGIDLQGAAGEFIAGNWIGTNASGASLGNGGNGVIVSDATSTTNSIGGLGTGDGNTIAFNGGNGVQDFGGLTGNHILGNSIHSNALLGILDNGMLDAPVLTSADTSGGTTNVAGSVSALGIPGVTFQVELFWSTTCDALGAGEGEQFLGRIEVITDPSGTADFSVSVAAVSGGVVTATASAPAGTSAFSACLVPDISALIGDIRTVILAEAAYQSTAFGRYGYLSCLATPTDCIVDYPPMAPWFLTEELASLATRVGYARGFSPGTELPHPELLVPGLASYAYTAAPVSGFGPGFCGDSTGALFRYDDGLPTAVDGQCVGGTPLI
ncbi:MAG: right-handed parallel beta-helix repeat-containing protein, partial [Acidobacteria bacterium]|nr:right-handed parallel beta-helix repeat-containing protein [Acidobacteriota bacterium]